MSKKPIEEDFQEMRFQFGANWTAFLEVLDDERILEAEGSLRDMLSVDVLTDKRFLDIGSGSGLFSLAARRLGAIVHSFDYDPLSVKCTQEVKARYYPNDDTWIIEEGSVLNDSYLISLGKFDVVYSWGVLHHTGNMEKALNNVILPVSDEGKLYIAIYNDQGIRSRFWKIVKKIYCSNWFGRFFILFVFIPLFVLHGIVTGLIKYKNPLGHFSNYKKKRGMSIYHDWIDWLGGYPYEVAKPDDIEKLYQDHGFHLERIIPTTRFGCNQYVFRKYNRVV